MRNRVNDECAKLSASLFHMIRSLFFVFALSFFVPMPCVAGESGSFKLDQTMLDLMGKEVEEAIREKLGEAPKVSAYRIVTTDELEKRFAAEIMKKLNPDWTEGDDVPRLLQIDIATVALRTMGKYVSEDHSVLICPEVIRRRARAFDEPELGSREGYCAVLVHEVVHAIDGKRYGYEKHLRDLEGEAARAYRHVIEGNAQRCAREICEEKGWGKGFEAFTRAIRKTWKGKNEASDLFRKMKLSGLYEAYVDGEVFMRRLEEIGGEKAVENAFRNPPKELLLIRNPVWFLDPKRRSREAADLDDILDRVILPEMDLEVWTHQKQTITSSQLAVMLSPLSEKRRNAIEEGVIQNKVLIFTPKEAPLSKFLTICLLQMKNPESAKMYVESWLEINRIKDEKLKAGNIRVISARYDDFEAESWTGTSALKEIQAGKKRVENRFLVATNGSYVVEISLPEGEKPIEELTDWLKNIEKELSQPKTGETQEPVKQ